MKTLIIHPFDETTDFLSTYPKYATIIRTELSNSILKKLIRQHDLIIMMGHGTDKGLFGFNRYVIDSSFADELRKKICICVWCYASDFVKKYDLKSPFSTGMFISDVDEAYFEQIKFDNYKQIDDSNFDFIMALNMSLSLDLNNLKENIYNGYIYNNTNPIKDFNIGGFYEQ